MVGTKFYNAWDHMKDRCNNPNNKFYHAYGGRGISYEDSWEKFDKFKSILIINNFKILKFWKRYNNKKKREN